MVCWRSVSRTGIGSLDPAAESIALRTSMFGPGTSTQFPAPSCRQVWLTDSVVGRVRIHAYSVVDTLDEWPNLKVSTMFTQYAFDNVYSTKFALCCG